MVKKSLLVLRFSWLPLGAALLMAFFSEVILYGDGYHLGSHNWFYTCVYSVLVTLCIVAPTWICILVAHKQGSLPYWMIAAVFLSTPIMSIVAWRVSYPLPRSSWTRILRAPERLVQLVDISTGFDGDGIYAQGLSGATYLYECNGHCEWKQEEPQPPAQKATPPSHCEIEYREWQLVPPQPFRSEQSISASATFCAKKIMFSLDDHGDVWLLNQGEIGILKIFQLFGYTVTGIIIGSLSSLLLAFALRGHLKTLQSKGS